MEHEFHRELKRQTADFFADNGWTVFQEFALPDRTIADVFAYRERGETVIAEVSTLYTASKAEAAFDKYRKWCNRLYLVTCDEMVLPHGEGAKIISWIDKHRQIGLLFMNKKRLTVMRSAGVHQIDPFASRQLWDRIDRSSIISQARVLTETK